MQVLPYQHLDRFSSCVLNSEERGLVETDSNHHLLGLPQAVHSGLCLEVDLRCMPSVKPILPLLMPSTP